MRLISKMRLICPGKKLTPARNITMPRGRKQPKLRAGKGAEASILARMIKPVQPVPRKDHRSDVVLAEQFTNNKGQLTCRFRHAGDAHDNNPPMHALAQWVKTAQEGDELFPRIAANKKENEFSHVLGRLS